MSEGRSQAVAGSKDADPIAAAAQGRAFVVDAGNSSGVQLHMTQPIRVVVVGSVRLYRDGLAQALYEHGFDVAGLPSVTGLDPEAAPDVVLVAADRHVGVDQIQAVTKAVPTARIVALAVPDAEGAIIACAEAGAAGFVTANESIDDLVDAITSAAHDELACSPSITAALARRLAALAGDRPAPEAFARLTRREAEISEYLRRGMSNKEIAAGLHIEVATVKNHVHNILEKLGVKRRTDIARVTEP